jgi:hypothetical protein
VSQCGHRIWLDTRIGALCCNNHARHSGRASRASPGEQEPESSNQRHLCIHVGRRLLGPGSRSPGRDDTPRPTQIFSTSHHHDRNGIDPLIGSATAVLVIWLRFAASGWLAS